MAELSKTEPAIGSKSPATQPLPAQMPPPLPVASPDAALHAPGAPVQRDGKLQASASAYKTTVTLPGTPGAPGSPRGPLPPPMPSAALAPKPPEIPTTGQPPAPPTYQDHFGATGYVKDGSDPKLLDLAKQATTKSPDLATGSFAAAIQAGKMGPADIKALQTQLQKKGYSVGDTGVDGKFGPRTYHALQQMLSGAPPDAPPGQASASHSAPTNGAANTDPSQAASSAASDPALANKLRAQEHNNYDNAKHQCFHYAWSMVQGAGGKGMDRAPSTTEGRGKPLDHLNQMISDGKVKTGDVIYVNKHPGTDDGSSRLSNGPHWFVYMGNGKFADQYGPPKVAAKERSAAEMQSFVQGRVIDRIFHPF